MLALRRHLRLVLMLAAALAAAAPAAVRAQGKLEARYSATLAGIPIGKGSWVVDITETKFMAAASGATSGLLRAFTGGQGTGSAHGVHLRISSGPRRDGWRGAELHKYRSGRYW